MKKYLSGITLLGMLFAAAIPGRAQSPKPVLTVDAIYIGSVAAGSQDQIGLLGTGVRFDHYDGHSMTMHLGGFFSYGLSFGGSFSAGIGIPFNQRGYSSDFVPTQI